MALVKQEENMLLQGVRRNKAKAAKRASENSCFRVRHPFLTSGCSQLASSFSNKTRWVH